MPRQKNLQQGILNRIAKHLSTSDTFFLINSYKLHLIKGGCIYHKGL
jgi:hypothetical protein